MIPRDVKAPTSPIPFHKLLKVAAIVDGSDPQTRELLDQIAAQGFEIEIGSSFERDVSEDAEIGAYIALIDGDRLEQARSLGRAVRESGFQTPLWGLANSHRISDMAVLGLVGEVDGYIYLGQQTPAFYAKQVTASIVNYGMTLLPPFFGGLMAYDGEANITFACPGHQGGQFYRKSAAGQLFFKHFGENVFRNDLCNADVDLGDLLIDAALRVQQAAVADRVEEGLAQEKDSPTDDADLDEWVREQMWDPLYRPLRRVEMEDASRNAKGELGIAGSVKRKV
jgi:ornithine decarboxylase